MTLIQRLLLGPRLIHEQQELIQAQSRLIRDLNRQLQRSHLDSLRGLRGVVGAWILHIEQPEIDLRDDLHDLDTYLSHQEATLEEHVL